MKPVDTGDPEQIEDRKDKDALRMEQEVADLTKIMEARSGRSFMWRLLGQCGVYRSSFSADLAEMAFSEGRRNIGLWLVRELERVDPALFAKMQQEDRVRKLEEEKQAEAAEKDDEE